jgi:NTP pyrophosphatase (non-canonical NTP hydrolase)
MMFETAMLFDLMEQLQKKAHRNSRDKGFWTGPENENVPTKLCLIHSEVSEWLEAWRKDPEAPCTKVVPHPITGDPQPVSVLDGGESRPITKEEEEAADVFIRLLDLCEYRGIDLARVALAKMAYNETRPQMHGGRRI